MDRMATLVATRGPALVGYAYLLAGSIQEAEDLVQDALVRTFSRRRTGTDMEWLEAYVRRAVLNAYIDRYRRDRRRRAIAHLMHDDADPDRPVGWFGALEYVGPGRARALLARFPDLWVVRDGVVVGYGGPPPDPDLDEQMRVQMATGGVRLSGNRQGFALVPCDPATGEPAWDVLLEPGDLELSPGEYELYPTVTLMVLEVTLPDGTVLTSDGPAAGALAAEPIALTITP